jgi:hypothetical protein
MLARIAMIAMTTSSSMSVKPDRGNGFLELSNVVMALNFRTVLWEVRV